MNRNDDIMIFSKKVQFFENKHGRQSAILDPPDPNFGLEERITQIHISTKYNTNMSAGNENFPIMSTDDGRQTPDLIRTIKTSANFELHTQFTQVSVW